MSPLDQFAAAARARRVDLPNTRPRAPSLVAALARPGIVAELKPASPTAGALRDITDPEGLARTLLRAGAAGISALAETARFGGGPELLAAAARAGGPTLMKDFVVTQRQLDLGHACGASATLLILPLLDAAHSEWAHPQEAIAAAHARGLEVLLEVYDEAGYREAARLDADIIGINNRDLRDPALPVDPTRAIRILRACGPVAPPVLALSGIETAAQLRATIEAGARGALVGGALMRAHEPASKLKELIEGLS